MVDFFSAFFSQLRLPCGIFFLFLALFDFFLLTISHLLHIFLSYIGQATNCPFLPLFQKHFAFSPHQYSLTKKPSCALPPPSSYSFWNVFLNFLLKHILSYYILPENIPKVNGLRFVHISQHYGKDLSVGRRGKCNNLI